MKKYIVLFALIMLFVFVISACTPDQSESIDNSSATSTISESAFNSDVTSQPVESDDKIGRAHV